jgi:hypothetical protein
MFDHYSNKLYRMIEYSITRLPLYFKEADFQEIDHIRNSMLTSKQKCINRLNIQVHLQ